MNWWRLLGLLFVFVPWLVIGGIVHLAKVVWVTPAEAFLSLESPRYLPLPVVTAGARATTHPD